MIDKVMMNINSMDTYVVEESKYPSG